jgi:hypothetical protein
MKFVFFTFLLSLASAPSFADSFADRQRALEDQIKQQDFDHFKQKVIERNQLFLKKLHQVVVSHRGANAPITCLTEDGPSGNDPFGTYPLASPGFVIKVKYSSFDSTLGYQPEPFSCSINMNDGNDCDFRVAADENADDAPLKLHLESVCITASLKKTVVNHGPIVSLP